MRRRELITLLGSAAAWPLAARAQPADRVRRVGVLMNYAATQPQGQAVVAAFIQRLRELGWNEGQNLRLDIRWNAADAELAKIYAAQLIGLMPDAILAGSTNNLTMIRQATSTVPVVFVEVADAVEQGIVPSLTHPGGNITGFSNFEFSVGGKWLDLLKEVVPGLTRVAVMFNPDTSPQSKFYMQAIEAVAPSLGVKATAVPVRTTADIEPALESFARQPNGGLILLPSSFTRLYFSLNPDLATRYGLPSISIANRSGLISYGPNEIEQVRDAAGYIDRILKGEKPADLPIQLSSKFRLTMNLKTAKALGLTIPEPILLTADEVIE